MGSTADSVRIYYVHSCPLKSQHSSQSLAHNPIKCLLKTQPTELGTHLPNRTSKFLIINLLLYV